MAKKKANLQEQLRDALRTEKPDRDEVMKIAEAIEASGQRLNPSLRHLPAGNVCVLVRGRIEQKSRASVAALGASAVSLETAASLEHGLWPPEPGSKPVSSPPRASTAESGPGPTEPESEVFDPRGRGLTQVSVVKKLEGVTSLEALAEIRELEAVKEPREWVTQAIDEREAQIRESSDEE